MEAVNHVRRAVNGEDSSGADAPALLSAVGLCGVAGLYVHRTLFR